MTTRYDTASGLDGFIATPDDSLGWLFPLGDVASGSLGAATGARGWEPWIPAAACPRVGRGGDDE